MSDLTAVVPRSLLDRARRIENEFVFSHTDALQVVRLATENGVAVLGVEMFGVKADLQVQDYSGYELALVGIWEAFVRANNDAALEFLRGHPSDSEHGYILTAASEREFRQLRQHLASDVD